MGGDRLFLWIMVLVLILGLAVPAIAAPVQLMARLDRNTAPVGDTVTLTLAYTLPAGCHLPDKPAIEGLNGLSITGMQAGPGGITIRFIVDSLTDLKIGPINLVYLDARDAQQTISANALTLKVTSNMEPSPDKQQLKPIQDIIPARPVWLTWLMWGALAVLVAFALAGLFFLYKRWSARKATQAIALPPYMLAQRDLEALVTGGLFERGEVKAFYFRFSEILKRYLEDLRRFPAAEFTSEEIAARIDAEIDRGVVVLLKRADLVKFADDVPTPSRKDQDVQAALAYIAATTPLPESEVKGGVQP